MHYVLSELGEGDPGRASTLYEVREKLGVYGKALLAMSLDNMSETGSPDTRVETLLDDIVGATILSATGAHWEETSVDFQTLNTDTRSTSIALDALTRLRPDQPLLPQAVRWLMVTREAGRWSTTQENAWAIIGLTDWLVESRELEADYDWSVALNNDEIGAGTATPGQINPPTDLSVPVAQLLRDEANELAFARTTAQGQLYYTTHLRYFLDAAAIDGRDHGIVVGRRFAATDGATGQTINTAAVGDVISVTVTIVAPNDLHHVLVGSADTGRCRTDRSAARHDIEPIRRTHDVQCGRRPTRPGLVATVGADVYGLSRRQGCPVRNLSTGGNVRIHVQCPGKLPGEYRVLPAYGEMMYFNEVWGRSEGSLFTVKK